ncbi:hypothetical protein CGZ93_00305 [Enemella dayhoffiae]|uniref:WXG100 family type VII secretion target n=1 Tax=Enemella dayhoffiae TaxID=2016507 RepID=A0A255HCM9_9ACTN|nr:hypothetical protein [Enemella dayhoffiae]OYO24956.1 hypothetical protein CGZ93_00305 [Enemella dayhoffiae]
MTESYVSAAGLRRWSSSLRRDGEEGAAQVGEALRAIGAEAGCWGADAAGDAFARAYLPAIAPLLAAALTSGDQVADLSDRLDTSAHNYQRTEAENSERAAR